MHAIKVCDFARIRKAQIHRQYRSINHFAHFSSDKEIKNLLAKTDECADERVKICALFSFAQTM